MQIQVRNQMRRDRAINAADSVIGEVHHVYSDLEADEVSRGNDPLEVLASLREINKRIAKDPERYVPKLRRDHAIEPLPLDEESTLYLRRLPGLPRDPFDRMLVCQAIVQGLILLTPDRDITQYPVRTLW